MGDSLDGVETLCDDGKHVEAMLSDLTGKHKGNIFEPTKGFKPLEMVQCPFRSLHHWPIFNEPD